MVVDTEGIFRYKVPVREKLIGYGFSESGGVFTISVPFYEGEFTLNVSVSESEIGYFVTDNSFGEEYIPVKAEDADGGFVEGVRSAVAEILREIASACFDTEKMKAEQTKRLFAHIAEVHNALPEFLWDGLPDCAVFRRADNGKWFAVVMSVRREKVQIEGSGNIEIVNLKADPESIFRLLEEDAFRPAYHMNKTHWISVRLDGTLEDSRLFALVEESRASAAKKSSRRSK